MIVYGPDASDESYPQVKKIHGLLENPSLYFFFPSKPSVKSIFNCHAYLPIGSNRIYQMSVFEHGVDPPFMAMKPWL
jgi:hypothetical protein